MKYTKLMMLVSGIRMKPSGIDKAAFRIREVACAVFLRDTGVRPRRIMNALDAVPGGMEITVDGFRTVEHSPSFRIPSMGRSRGEKRAQRGLSPRRAVNQCAHALLAYFFSFALSDMGMYERAFDTGQPFFVSSASFWNALSSIPSMEASVEMSMRVMAKMSPCLSM
jgi:hypothetical protein